ncbi:MAG: hypothetical protein GC178_09895 [Flavobacteriales bacterium]|nr:hypothetical protein [Flavobacteriales bacterium]
MNYFTPSYKSLLKIALMAPFATLVLHAETKASTANLGFLFKLIIMLFFVFGALWKVRNKRLPDFFVLGVLFLIKGIIIVPDKVIYLETAVKVSFIAFILPLTVLYALKSPIAKIDKYIFYLCALLISSTVPYHLGLLQNDLAIEVGKYDMRKYSAEGVLFTGPFENIHNAAITLTFCSIGTLKFFRATRKLGVKLILLLLVLVGLLGVYLTYVRTAWVMLLFGGVVMLFYNQRTLKKKIRNYALAVLTVICVLWVYSQSEVVQMRLNNTNAYGGEALSEGSGRLVFWGTMIQYLGELDLFRLAFGTGRESGMDYMYEKINRRLFSHNGFLDILVSTGVIGLLLFLAMIGKIGVKIIQPFHLSQRTRHHNLSIVFSIMLMVSIFFQSHQMFWALILVGLLVGMNMHEVRQLELTKNGR